jgi:phosphoglycerate dehydrogenase-like enzyme
MSGERLRVVVLPNFAAELAQALAAQPFAVQPLIETLDQRSDAEIAVLLSETDVVVSPSFKTAWRNERSASRLRLVHSSGAGIDAIALANLPPGCHVCNVYGHERGVAEHAFLLMLALHRNLSVLDAALRKGDWSPQLGYLPEMRGRNLLVLGLGHIGGELVRWGNFLGMSVTALTRTPSLERGEALGLRAVGSLRDLHRHLGDADFVVVAIPSTPDTENLIGEPEFRQMKPTAFLINVGRARVINEQALYEALSDRRIAGAGLDVWYEYPASLRDKKLPSNLPLHELDNVIMTPHKPTIETMVYRWRFIAENIRRLAEGEPLQNIVYTAPIIVS